METRRYSGRVTASISLDQSDEWAYVVRLQAAGCPPFSCKVRLTSTHKKQFERSDSPDALDVAFAEAVSFAEKDGAAVVKVAAFNSGGVVISRQPLGAAPPKRGAKKNRTLLFVVGGILLLGLFKVAVCDTRNERRVTTDTTVRTHRSRYENSPSKHPAVREAFDGAGTNVAGPFTLYRGAVFVSVQHRWPAESEHFSVTLAGADGTHVSGGLIVNETSSRRRPAAPVDARRMVTIRRTGSYVIQMNADPGSPWAVQVEQAAQ